MITRRPNAFLQEKIFIPFSHGEVTADTTLKLWKTPSGRRFRIDRVAYINPTGLAADATNIFTVKILNAALVAASWSTLTGAQGTLTADTFVELVNSATDANLVLPVDTVLSLFLDEGGTATLPAGYGIIEGRYL